MPALGRKSEARSEKGKGPLSGVNCIKKSGHSVPKELHTMKRNQATVACAGYKTLIMGDSGHSSGFTAWQGHTSPLNTDPLWPG